VDQRSLEVGPSADSHRARGFPTSRTLVLLVGGNPLPNYLAARILAEVRPWKTAVLFYTDRTEPVKDRLMAALSEMGSIEARFVADHASPHSIRASWAELTAPVHLHYTGGTKAMAVHLYDRWREGAAELGAAWGSEASYLDEGSEALRFDDGTSLRLADLDLQLELEALARLHGLHDLEIGPREEGGSPSQDDAVAMAKSLLAWPANASRVYDALPEPKSASRLKAEAPVDLAAFGLEGLRHPMIPAASWSKATKKAWLRFLRGGWLEDWMADLIRPLVPPHPVVVDVRAKIDGRDFQVDLVVLRRHRVYAISCTTAQSPGRCKAKLFEVAFRARQLGGDLARSALVCFLDEWLSDVQKDVSAGWEATNQPRAFGLQHLREWQDGQTEALVRWLDK
jgi:hypothetical protein